MHITFETLLPFIIVGAILYALYKRMIGEPLQSKELYGTPLLLIGLGIHTLLKISGWEAIDVVWLIIAITVGILLGMIRGVTLTLFTKNAVLWYRYSVKTIIIFVVAFLINFGVGYMAHASGADEKTRPITLSMGVGFAGEAIVVGLRASRLGGRFAPNKD